MSAARGAERAAAVEALCRANDALLVDRRGGRAQRTLPSGEALKGVVRDLRAALFPGHFGAPDLSDQGLARFVRDALDSALGALEEQVGRGLHFSCDGVADPCTACSARAGSVTEALLAELPSIRELLGSDVEAACTGDPAATSPDEVIVSYPGLVAITHHRIAHALQRLGVPLIPRMIAELSHAVTGVDIHPGARIGGRFFIDHGTGVVIGETCEIGDNVRLYQGVTLGAKSFALDDRGHPVKGVPRHPRVEDDVTIYAGATILGRIVIGRGSTIGGNVWLTRSLPPGSRISQAQARPEVYWDGGGI